MKKLISYLWWKRGLKKIVERKKKPKGGANTAKVEVESKRKRSEGLEDIKKGLHKIKKGLGGKKYENKHKKS